MFIEISSNIPGTGIDLDDWNASYEGCNCANYSDSCCYSNLCSCSSHHKTKAYKLSSSVDNKSKLVLNLDLMNTAAQINECSLECSCDQDKCLNRLVQNGVDLKLEVFDCLQLDKGKGVRAKESIHAGAFICEYMGEVISKSEAEKRCNERTLLNEQNFILVLREHYSAAAEAAAHDLVVTCIDARNYGNIGRFVNHSCEPNSVVVPVRIDNVIPHAALFALRDIHADEELSYDYNGGQSVLGSENKCLCMASGCRGFLPANKF